MTKKNVAIICGGKSPEHKISLISAQNVIRSLDLGLFNPVIIGISKEGDWYYYPADITLENPDSPTDIRLIPSEHKIFLSQNGTDQGIYDVSDHVHLRDIDVVFPILHGNNGEDGSIQGLCKIAGLPFVGCGINGSALCMDKDLMKKILRDATIPVAPSVTVTLSSKPAYSYDVVSSTLGDTLYIKPSNLGSSIGVECVSDKQAYNRAIDTALSYCDKVLVESRVIGREIECAVLGNENPQASVIGEIIPQVDFYTFENKYVNADGALLSIPADLPEEVALKAQELAVIAFKALDCLGMSRVDMFYQDDGTLLINEVNTIPGFTNISMYPKLWEHGGVPQSDLITRLITFALERYKKENNYKHIL